MGISKIVKIFTDYIYASFIFTLFWWLLDFLFIIWIFFTNNISNESQARGSIVVFLLFLSLLIIPNALVFLDSKNADVISENNLEFKKKLKILFDTVKDNYCSKVIFGLKFSVTLLTLIIALAVYSKFMPQFSYIIMLIMCIFLSSFFLGITILPNNRSFILCIKKGFVLQVINPVKTLINYFLITFFIIITPLISKIIIFLIFPGAIILYINRVSSCLQKEK